MTVDERAGEGKGLTCENIHFIKDLGHMVYLIISASSENILHTSLNKVQNKGS